MPKKEEIWKGILKDLETKFSKSSLHPWFSQANLGCLEPDLALIEVPNKFFARWLEEHYADHIKRAFGRLLDPVPEVRFMFSDAPNGPPSEGSGPEKGVRGFQPLEADKTFERFVVGRSNEFAFISSREVALRPAETYNPLYIFGDSGLGKTHLLNAIGHEYLAAHPGMQVTSVHAEQFLSTFLRAGKRRSLPEFREVFSAPDLLLMDDVHLLGGKRRIQSEFVSLLNLLLTSDKQVVVTSKYPPKEIQDLDEQLRSRLEWGLLVELKSPDQKMKIRIVQQKAEEEKMFIPDDVGFYLAKISGDIGVLMKNMVRLIAHASLSRERIDISAAKSVVRSRSSPDVSIQEIQKLTAAYFNLPLADLLSDKKTRKISYPRQLAMFLCRDFTHLSLKEIGEGFGKKDHSSVIYAVRRIEREKEQNREVLKDLSKLRSLLE